ncbi:Nucleolar protein 11-like [Collichthys lucidus]|uniref:Beta-2-glycoprotein 1 n=1 Tax=Collichthys lucidus TaxID=240159 RepID=A0A4U5U4D4_COLLU|nr:Nucleolar protein 11-like [Collichthys lucidus]
MYGHGWTYECNPPKAPSYERGTCMADGTATEPPVCQDVSCSIPTSIPNGFITFAVRRQHGYKEKVKYACNDHYVLDGQAEIQCQNTGNWSSMPVCRAPCTVGIKRGRIFYNTRKIWIEELKPNRVLHGEHVAFYCKNKVDKCGYPVASTCNDGTLPIPACFEAKRCPYPDPPSNGELYYEDVVYQSTINYTCDKGYILIGSDSAECLANGTWSTAVPECIPVTCGLAPIPEFGMIIYDKTISGNSTDYGVHGTYKCLPPYVLFGDPRTECTLSGTWTKTPECRVVTCPPPENIDRGYMSSSLPRDYDYMETVKYGCHGDYEIEGSFQIVCQQDGKWSEKPSCKAPCSVSIQRGRILYKGRKIWIKDLSPNKVLHKEIVSFYCMNKSRNCGYTVPSQCIDGRLEPPDCFEDPTSSTFFSSSMAALYEGYTLCGLVPAQTLSNSGIQGVETERDSDHVVVTDSSRSVTLYKVSDQKPLSSWTVKQGQTLTCSAVYNSQTKEYVAVTDGKVSSDVWRVHCVPGGQPVVLFQRGAVRLLDSLLSAPQQSIEEVLSQEETIRWSTNIVAESQQFVIFTTEQKGDNFLYLQRLNPNTLQRYRLEREEPGLSPLSFSASYRDKHIQLLYLYPNGHVYQSVVSLRSPGADDGAQALPLPRNLLLGLAVGEGLLEAASALVLDEAHVAVVGVPHPSAGVSKDFLCIWNTNFQTLQAGKEMAGKIYGQLWTYSNKLFIPHGKTLSVIPYECPKSSLAAALGKLRQAKTEESKALASVPSWNNILHGDKAQPSRTVETRKTRTTRKSQSAPSLTIDQVLELIKEAPAEEVHEEVEGLISRADIQDLQPSVWQLASTLVSRSLADPAFYTPSLLAQLVHTQSLSHSMPDVDAEKASLEPESVAFMETLIAREHGQGGLQNGFSPTSCGGDALSGGGTVIKTRAEDEENPSTPPEQICPVGLHKAVLLLHRNEVLRTAYSDTFLLPHLKDLCSEHVVVRLVSELGKIEGSLQELNKMKVNKDVGQYSIEVIELF